MQSALVHRLWWFYSSQYFLESQWRHTCTFQFITSDIHFLLNNIKYAHVDKSTGFVQLQNARVLLCNPLKNHSGSKLPKNRAFFLSASEFFLAGCKSFSVTWRRKNNFGMLGEMSKTLFHCNRKKSWNNKSCANKKSH